MSTILFIILVLALFILLTNIHYIIKNSNVEKKIITIQPYLGILFLLLFLSFVIYSSVHFSKFFLPVPASIHGQETVPLYQATLALTGSVFLITHILLFYFIYRFRYKNNRKAVFITGNNKVEFLWTIIPLLSFLILFIWGQILWAKLMNVSKSEVMEIEIMGQQFNWWVRYPGKDKILGHFDYRLINTNNNNMGIDFSDPNSKDDIIPIQLHLLKDKPVRLRMRSIDVIHSVYIPHLRVKMDAVPGMGTYIQFTPIISTNEMRKRLNNPFFNYEITCAELCGRMHFAMKLIVKVDDAIEYEKWNKSQKSWLISHPELTK